MRRKYERGTKKDMETQKERAETDGAVKKRGQRKIRESEREPDREREWTVKERREIKKGTKYETKTEKEMG